MWKRVDVQQTLEDQGASPVNEEDSRELSETKEQPNIKQNSRSSETNSLGVVTEGRKKRKRDIKKQMNTVETKNQTSDACGPSNFRLFVGNLGQDVTTEMLDKAFRKYHSLTNANVVLDKRTQVSRGYGFVSFKDASDYLHAFQQMNKKYIGRKPVVLKRAQ